MTRVASLERMALEPDQRISEVVEREQSRLRNFIRRRVADPRDAEDILQEVFYELVEATRLLMPIEHVTGWLLQIGVMLPSPEAGPEALYVRNVLLEELEFALDELPEEQREVFVAHEIEGRSFKEMSAASGVS